jgi:hypothetical protein
MTPDSPETLLTQAKKSLAEVSAAFFGNPETIECGPERIVINQAEPGKYRVELTFKADPRSPSLRILRYPKPNVAPSFESEHSPDPEPLQRHFDAVSDGSRLVWLEQSVSGDPLSSADIVEIVHGLL